MSQDSAAAQETGYRHRPWLAAVLSVLLPGMGQAYAGRPLLGLMIALPAVLVIAALVGIATGAIGGFRNSLFASEFLVAVLVANALVLAWRGMAIAHAGLTPWARIQGHDRRVAAMTVALLLVLIVAMHAWVGIVVVQFNTTLGQIFEPAQRVPPRLAPGSGEEPDEPVNEPRFEWDGVERVNILLLGTDAAPGREAALTDVILVVSVDPVGPCPTSRSTRTGSSRTR
jgi:hypothetical protein